MQPMTDVFVCGPGGLAQLFQVPDVRGGGGEMAATTERYLELRVVYPDGTESEGFKIKDEALADLRAFFKTLPDGRYRIYLVRTENHSERLVIEVDVRRGRVIDVSDDSEGTRDRPPTDEEAAEPAVPLEQNPLLEPCQTGMDKETWRSRRQGEQARIEDQDGERVSMSPGLLVSMSLPAAALAAQPWSRRVDDALAGGDENAWRRLRRAGRRGRASRPRRQLAPVPGCELPPTSTTIRTNALPRLSARDRRFAITRLRSAMRYCHACQEELDSTSLAAGRCANCGTVIRTIAQRTLEDKKLLHQPSAGGGDRRFARIDRPRSVRADTETGDGGATLDSLPGDTSIETPSDRAKKSGPQRKSPTICRTRRT